MAEVAVSSVSKVWLNIFEIPGQVAGKVLSGEIQLAEKVLDKVSKKCPGKTSFRNKCQKNVLEVFLKCFQGANTQEGARKARAPPGCLLRPKAAPLGNT